MRPTGSTLRCVAGILLVAVGLACLLHSGEYVWDVAKLGAEPNFGYQLRIVLEFLAALPLVAAGVLLPFYRGRLGAYIGFFGEIAVGVMWFVRENGWHAMWAQSDFRLILFITCTVIVIGAIGLARVLTNRLRRRLHIVHRHDRQSSDE